MVNRPRGSFYLSNWVGDSDSEYCTLSDFGVTGVQPVDSVARDLLKLNKLEG
jgi:hypothetical protein